jgi:hypothetical protein
LVEFTPEPFPQHLECPLVLGELGRKVALSRASNAFFACWATIASSIEARRINGVDPHRYSADLPPGS